MSRAEQLRAAVIGMAVRYGTSCQDFAYAIADGHSADERVRLCRTRKRQFAALQRLTRALSSLAEGGTR